MCPYNTHHGCGPNRRWRLSPSMEIPILQPVYDILRSLTPSQLNVFTKLIMLFQTQLVLTSRTKLDVSSSLLNCLFTLQVRTCGGHLDLSINLKQDRRKVANILMNAKLHHFSVTVIKPKILCASVGVDEASKFRSVTVQAPQTWREGKTVVITTGK